MAAAAEALPPSIKRSAYERREWPALDEPSADDIERYWRAGVLRHKLDALQQAIYDWWWGLGPEHREVVLMIGRRVGKTFLCACIAVEIALSGKTQQLFVATDGVQVKSFLIPTFDKIFEDAPEELQGQWKRHDSAYVFKNGSKIVLKGAGDMRKANALRGPFFHCVWCDEAGYNPVLRHIVKAIFLPTLKDQPGAKITSYSNAPESPSHDLMILASEAEEKGAYYHATIFDSPRYSLEEIDQYAEELGGYETSDFQREAMARVTNDEYMAVVPEWPSRAHDTWAFDPTSSRALEVTPETPQQYIQPPLVRDVDRPPYFDIYTVVDDGFDDLVSILTFYWDFDRQRLVFEGEAELHKPTTDLVAEAVEQLEQATWGDYWARVSQAHGWERRPYKRRLEGHKKAILDLNQLYGFDFVQARNRDLHAQVKRFRKMVRLAEVVVNPRCESLSAHLDAAYWNASRSKFARPAKAPRSGEARYFGHFDHVASAVIASGIIDRDHDPYPMSLVHPISRRVPERVASPPVSPMQLGREETEPEPGWLEDMQPRMRRRR